MDLLHHILPLKEKYLRFLFHRPYTNGISDVNTTTTGVGITSGGGLGIGGAKTSGTSQTALSQSVAPPSKYSYIRELLIAFIAVPLICGILNDLFLPFKWKWVYILSFVYLYFHTYAVKWYLTE